MKQFTFLASIMLMLCLGLAACGTADTPGTSSQTSPRPAPATDVAPTPSANTSIVPSTAAQPTNASAAPTLLSVKLSGGFCQYGQCWAVREIAEDGSYVAADGTGAQTSGTLDPALLAELKAQIAQADFAQIKAQPFTGTCPIAYDGQEATYTFHTAGGEETFSNCEVGIDSASPLFVAVEQALASMFPQ